MQICIPFVATVDFSMWSASQGYELCKEGDEYLLWMGRLLIIVTPRH